MKNVIRFALVVVFCLALVLSGCSSKSNPSGSSSGTDSKSTSTDSNSSSNNVKMSGLPIVDNPITFKALMVTSSRIDYNTNSPYYQELAAKTNVKFQIDQVNTANTDKINLMFASRKYPDLLLHTKATDKQMLDAVAAGDFLPLGDLIQKYAPNWTKILKDHPEVRKAITFPDGKIYSLPTVTELPEQIGIRDQWLINKKWLDQLGMKVPTTTDEFEAALKAFKAHAGEGSIPKNAIPWYFLFNQYVGGQMDIYGGSFGILAPDENYISVKDGKVQFAAMNPDIKKPLAYMNKLYSEGLIPSEAFTDDFNAYLAKYRSVPGIAGSISGFVNDNPDYVPMLPPKAPGVQTQLYRQQTSIVVKNQFTIPKNNPNPGAAIRLADVMAEPDWTVEDWFGMIGDKYVKKDSDTYTVLPTKADDNNFPNVDGLAAITSEVAAKIKFDPNTSYYGRQKAVELYTPVLAPLDNLYPNLMFTPEESDKLAQLRTDINGYIKETFAKWITRGGMDQEWDGYISKLNSMKVNDMMQILQTALDRYNKG